MADRLKKVQKALRKKDLGGIECTEVRNCIRLEGEMDSWTDVVKAGDRREIRL